MRGDCELYYILTMDRTIDVTGPSHGNDDLQIIVWEKRYDTNIPLIDNQHKEFVNLINHLHHSCTGGESVGAAFKDAMSRLVNYVHFHFKTEMQVMEKIKFPGIKEHSEQHDSLVKDILEAANDYRAGKRFVPHNFVRTLRDWVLGHIALYDKRYADYILDLKKKGMLPS